MILGTGKNYPQNDSFTKPHGQSQEHTPQEKKPDTKNTLYDSIYVKL